MKPIGLLVALFLMHALITARASVDHTYLELFAFAFSSWPARQVFSDLTVAMTLVCAWMVSDAKKTGRNAWPYVAAAVLVGAFAPLAYLIVGEVRKLRAARRSAT